MTSSRLVPATAASRLLVLGLLVVFSLMLTACGGGAAATATPTVRLGDLVTAKSIGDKNAPQNITTTFAPGDTIYAVVKVDNFPNAGHVFSRWSREGQKLEDTPEIVANQDYKDTYLEFHIDSTNNRLQSGKWTVQLFINGNAGPTTNFTIR